MEVDFGEFQTLIDSIGGIDLELTQDEADYICGRKRDVTYPQQLRTDWNLHEGVNHLTGEQALIHARNRSLGNDYARTDRQRAVLMAIINKVKQMDAVSIVNLLTRFCTADHRHDLRRNSGVCDGALQMNLTVSTLTASRQRAPIPAR